MTKKTRGERRKSRRRTYDGQKIAIRAVAPHLVVFPGEGQMHSRALKSRIRAEELVRTLLRKGVPADKIGYYKRGGLVAEITLGKAG